MLVLVQQFVAVQVCCSHSLHIPPLSYPRSSTRFGMSVVRILRPRPPILPSGGSLSPRRYLPLGSSTLRAYSTWLQQCLERRQRHRPQGASQLDCLRMGTKIALILKSFRHRDELNTYWKSSWQSVAICYSWSGSRRSARHLPSRSSHRRNHLKEET
jgi:hypothetical protein